MADSGTATATIVFTDVVASTEVRSRLGEADSDRLFRAHERSLSAVVRAHRGLVVKAAGDGIMATFDAASDAVSAAVAMLREVARLARSSPDQALRLRVGVAAGDVSWDDGDCFGLPVVVAARLEAMAEPDQILVSQVVRWLAGDRAGNAYVHLGPRELKGLPDPVDVYQVEWRLPPGDEEADAAAATVELPAAVAIAPTWQFVGRVPELAELTGAWAGVADGGTRLVLVGGEAGAGKTRLAVEFARRRHGEGALVLFGGCDSELGLPYQPWVQALDHLLSASPTELVLDELRPDLAELLVLLPRLDRLAPGLTRPPSLDPDTDQHRLFAAVDAVLAHAARTRPVVLVLDDLHWAGRQTLALLRHLAHSPSAHHLLIIGTFRDTSAEITDPLASCLADLRRLDNTSRLRLEGLDEANVERFVAEATGHALDDELRRLASTLSRRSAGNAFYVGELWRHLVSTGAVRREGDRWTVREGAAGLGVPASVKEVVSARLATLSPSARSVIELAAVAGPRVELPVLQLAAPDEADELGPALDELVDAGLLDTGGEVLLTYHFPHALVRDTVEETVAPMARAGLHLRVAEAIEQVHETDRRPVLAELARHFTAAASLGSSAKARYYLRRAGAQALRSSAFDLAITHLSTGIALCPPGDAERVELMLEMATAQLRDGRYSESMATCGEAFAEAGALDDPTLAARAAIGFEQAVHMPGLPGEPAVAIVVEAMDRVGTSDEQLHTRLQASLARAYSHAGRTSEALEAVEVALALARRGDDQVALGAALEAALIATTDPDRLLVLADELDHMAASSADPWHSLYATSNRLRALITLGRLDEAVVELARHREVSERGRYAAFQFVGQAFEVVLHLARGHFDEAEAAAEAAHAFGAAGNTPFDAGVYGLQMFAIRREQGRLGEVAPVLELVASRRVDEPLWRPGLAALYADLGMLEAARAEFEALAPDRFGAVARDSVWPACATFLAEVCLRLGDARRAAVLYDELAPHAGRNLMVGMTICFGPADRFLGGLAALAGLDQQAAGHFEAATVLAERSGSPVWTAHVLHDHAAFLADRGERRRAVDLGTRAHQTALVVGMAGLAAQPIPGTQGRTERTVAPAADPLPDGLSAREVEVLRLVAAGRSNREVGEVLFISQNTVANHVRAILQKTACANRAEAAVYAAHHQLLDR